MNIQQLIRPNIRKLKPYSSAREEYSGEAQILLDANENPFENGMNRYPDPMQTELKNEIAKLKNVNPENIFLGNGSDEIIDLLIRIFCEPGKDEILVMPPTFGMYEVAANLSNVGVRKIPLNPWFQPDERRIFREKVWQEMKMVFLCSPNNPTGNSFDRADLKNYIKRFPGITVIDEAYIDFARQESVLEWLDLSDKTVILQTLSKAWGLAGIRLGMAFASTKIVELLNRVKMPYNVNILTQKAALEALKNSDEKDRQVREILAQKVILKSKLETFDFVEKVFPSDANFFLVRVKNPSDLIQFLRQKGIIIRDRSKVILCENCVRITVGKKEENEAFIEALNAFQKLHEIGTLI